MPGSYGHLITRFFDYLKAKPPSEADENLIASWVTPEEYDLFAQQTSRDRAHGLHAVSVVLATGCEDGEVVRAAALHDVGKRHSGLGIVGRSVASILIKLRLPLSRRMRLYRDHGEAGARDLEVIGSSSLVVEFAGSHHHHRPPSISPEIWDLLQLADQPSKDQVLDSGR